MARIVYLVSMFMAETMTEAEEQELDEWISSSISNQRLFEEMTSTGNIKQ